MIDDRAMPLDRARAAPWLLAEITRPTPEGFVFRRERGNLWNIARRHYFEIKLAAAARAAAVRLRLVRAGGDGRRRVALDAPATP